MTTDPEQYNTNRYKDTEWVTPEDEVLLNGIDSTMTNYAEVDKQLDEVYKSIPTYENPMKIIKNLELQYDSLGDEARTDFLLDLERCLYIDDEHEIKRSAIKYFLDSHKNKSEND